MPEFHSAALSVIHNDDMAPGSGPELHRHPYEEVFLILEGEATFTLGGETRVATAGDFLIAPPVVKLLDTRVGEVHVLSLLLGWPSR